MNKSADREGPRTVASTNGEIEQQGKGRVRRRLVQSTLLPHKSPPIESKGDQKENRECNGENKEGDEEYVRSQGKKRRERKGNKTSPIKTPKTPRRVKETSSTEATPEKDITPRKPKASSRNGAPRKKSTPKKNGANNGKNAAQLVANGDAVVQIPNLRLEAKAMAEENARLFGGKQTHPFFLSRNVGKRNQETSIQRKHKSITIGPIHVFEKEEEVAASLDWRNWKFFEKSFTNSSSLEASFSSIFECTVKSLCFDKFPHLLHPPGSSLLEDNFSLDESLPQQEFLHEASVAMPSDVQEYDVGEIGLPSGCVRKSDAQQQSKIKHEHGRTASHLGSANQLDDRLWTDKYQPKRAVEICGNDESVKLLNEWLYTWHQESYQSSKASFGGVECDMQDPEYDCSQDSENCSDEDRLKNVLLVTGPVGSGKSAAIYACAKEQGFRVFEANASECRNGSVLKERFGALQSQNTLDSRFFQWSQESSVEIQSVGITNSPAVLPNVKFTQELSSKVIEAIRISDENAEATETPEKFVCKDNSVGVGQGQLKTLILFEDVDIIFPEDRGFITAIQHIVDKVKGPVILTSNSAKPVLPDNLDSLEVCFKAPLKKELLQHLNAVCFAEEVNVQPHLVEQLIELCQRDIRKSIMHLQFWCQGQQFSQGSRMKKLFNQMPFDPESGYQILPKMIPWDFPSQLSELVEKEIAMSLCRMEENSFFIGFIEDKFFVNDMQDNLEKQIYETDSIEAKKKAMLSKNCSDHDSIDFLTSFDAACDLFDSSSSPLPFSQRNCRRKLVVMSSDSEDDPLKEIVPRTPEKDTSSEIFLRVDDGFPSHHPSMEKSISPSADLQLCSGAQKLEESLYQCSQTATELNVTDTCVSVDVSCVPESSFVPETEINDGTKLLCGSLSCGQVDEVLEEASVSNEFRQNTLLVEADNLDESVPKFDKNSDLFGDIFDMIGLSSNEEVEDSQNELMEASTREQLMDEYSRIDFSRKFKQQQKYSSSAVIDTVRESWRKLRDRHADLRHFVAAEHEHSSVIMKLACEMSNLISEAELLHTKCQSLDSFGLPVDFFEESDAFSWYNEQLQMASTVLQHGFCSYAKDIAAAGTNMGFESRADLTWEMLWNTSKMKVSPGQNTDKRTLHVEQGAGTSLSENETVLNRCSEQRSHLIKIIHSIVPSRAYMTMKGDAFHEYLSSLCYISRSESSRLSEGVNESSRRRGRAPRNYLSNGSLMLSPEEILLLGLSNIYGRLHPS